MAVELIYASDATTVFRAQVAFTDEMTIQAVIEQSGLMQAHPELERVDFKVGIYAQTKTVDDIVTEGDRVEIYRSLTIDPKDARRIRAENKRKKMGIKLFGA